MRILNVNRNSLCNIGELLGSARVTHVPGEFCALIGKCLKRQTPSPSARQSGPQPLPPLTTTPSIPQPALPEGRPITALPPSGLPPLTGPGRRRGRRTAPRAPARPAALPKARDPAAPVTPWAGPASTSCASGRRSKPPPPPPHPARGGRPLTGTTRPAPSETPPPLHTRDRDGPPPSPPAGPPPPLTDQSTAPSLPATNRGLRRSLARPPPGSSSAAPLLSVTPLTPPLEAGGRSPGCTASITRAWAGSAEAAVPPPKRFTGCLLPLPPASSPGRRTARGALRKSSARRRWVRWEDGRRFRKDLGLIHICFGFKSWCD